MNARYPIHWLRRWWRGRSEPLTRLLYDSVLDGPRTQVQPPPLAIPRKPYKPQRPSKSWPPESMEHTGPIRELGGERFCEKCGIGVDEDGMFERAANGYGRRISPAKADELGGHQWQGSK